MQGKAHIQVVGNAKKPKKNSQKMICVRARFKREGESKREKARENVNKSTSVCGG